MKIGIAFAAALALAIFAFLGLRSVLDDGGPDEAASEAATLVEGDAGELGERLDEAGIDVSGEQAFQGGDWTLETDDPAVEEPDDEATTHTIEIGGTAILTLPRTVGDAGGELLLYDGTARESLPISLDVELSKGEDGWDAATVTIGDPYPRPPDAKEAELAGLAGTAREAVRSALAQPGPASHEQPDVYATEVGGITGPVDRALVVATGCEFGMAEAELDGVRPAESASGASTAGHLQVAEFTGLAGVRPTALDCRRGGPPELPVSAAFGVQLARSRLSADSGWHVTRLMVEFRGAEARDVYSVAAETTGDEREAPEFAADLAEAVEQGGAG